MKKIIFLIFMFVFFSCNSPLRLINNKKKLQEIVIKDTLLLKTIDKYLINNKSEESLVVLMSKDINNKNAKKYINHIIGLRNIFTYPISGFTKYNNDTILIYSKKDGYINPRNYPNNFIFNLKNQLINDWNMIKWKGEEGFEFKTPINHSTPWTFKKGKIDSAYNIKFNRGKFLYNIKYFDYEGYDNLDSLKIIYKKREAYFNPENEIIDEGID